MALTAAGCMFAGPADPIESYTAVRIRKLHGREAIGRGTEGLTVEGVQKTVNHCNGYGIETI
jgi:hypothetical protein